MLYGSRVEEKGTGSVIFIGLFHLHHLNYGLHKTKLLKVNWKRDLHSYYLPFLLNLTTLSWHYRLTYWSTGLFHKGLVLYKRTEKSTAKTVRPLCQERECFHMSGGNVDVKLVDKIKSNKTILTNFLNHRYLFNDMNGFS